MKRANVLLLVFSTLVALAMVEGGYRFLLSRKLAFEATAKTKPEPAPTFGFYAYPGPWKYDEQQGFQFNENTWLSGSIVKGAFGGCGGGGAGNKYGNVHALRSDYEKAAVKILLLGSSFTMVADKNGMTMSDILEKRLSEKLGKPVSILNFSRDSTGLLTSFDIAKAKIPELKPDLLLFIFNATQFTYVRHWRVVHPAPHQQAIWRMAFSLNPDPKLSDRRRTILHPTVISSEVTQEWCQQMMKAMSANDQGQLRDDPLVRKLITSYQALQKDISSPVLAVDFYSLGASFVYNKLVHKNPFFGMKMYDEKAGFGVPYDDYASDKRFVEAIQAVKSSGIPFLMVHIPILLNDKIENGYAFSEYGVPPKQGLALASSIEHVTGQKTIRLVPYYDAADRERDPRSLTVSKDDNHPNSDGTAAMANAMERLLLETYFANKK